MKRILAARLFSLILITNIIVLFIFGESSVSSKGYTCWTWDCILGRIEHYYVFYSFVHFFLALTYTITFHYLNLFKRLERKKIIKWLLLIFCMFLWGWLIYGANKYYYKIWTNESFGKWLLIVLMEYIFELVIIYKVLVWMGITNYILVTWWVLKKMVDH